MAKAILITATLTGIFCAGFAIVIDAVLTAVPMLAAIALAFVSGFFGSLFAQLVLGRRP